MHKFQTTKLIFPQTSYIELQQKKILRVWYQSSNRVDFVDIRPAIQTSFCHNSNCLSLFTKVETFIFNKQTTVLNHLQKIVTIKKISSDIANLVRGISIGFKKKMVLRGRAFHWKVNKKYIQAKVTYTSSFMLKFRTNLVRLPRLLDTKVKIFKIKTRRKGLEKATIKIHGNNWMSLNQLTCNLRKLKKPNFFTGVGIRYVKDIIPNRSQNQLLVLKNKGKKQLNKAVVKYK